MSTKLPEVGEREIISDGENKYMVLKISQDEQSDEKVFLTPVIEKSYEETVRMKKNHRG
jgi:hypothetical protein